MGGLFVTTDVEADVANAALVVTFGNVDALEESVRGVEVGLDLGKGRDVVVIPAGLGRGSRSLETENYFEVGKVDGLVGAVEAFGVFGENTSDGEGREIFHRGSSLFDITRELSDTDGLWTTKPEETKTPALAVKRVGCGGGRGG